MKLIIPIIVIMSKGIIKYFTKLEISTNLNKTLQTFTQLKKFGKQYTTSQNKSKRQYKQNNFLQNT